jgi:hypothetical protein
MGKYETGIRFILREPVELGRCALDKGNFGEGLALEWLLYREVPVDEVWGLRRGNLHGRYVSFYRTPETLRPLWRERVYLFEWLHRMVTPYSLYPLDRQRFNRFWTFWVPRDSDWVNAARFVAAVMVKEGWLPRGEERVPALQVPERFGPTPEERRAYPVVETPTEDFVVLPLFYVACSAGDYILLKWRRGPVTRFVGLEVLEVKTGGSYLSRKQRESVRYLYTVTQRIRALLNRPIEVEYKLVRVELVPKNRPYEALVSAKTLLRVQGEVDGVGVAAGT